MTAQWVRAQFDVQQRHGWETVSGYTWQAWGVRRYNLCWEVTHLPTGLRVTYFDGRTLGDAKRLCEKINGLTDWARVRVLKNGRCSHPSLGRKVKAALTEYRAEFGGGAP
jgi:hypothetical protein